MKKTYEQMVDDFNKAVTNGTHYMAETHFLTFRRTKKGIKVGYTCGKPQEISELWRNVKNAADKGYYCTFGLPF